MIKINKKIEYALMALKFLQDTKEQNPKSAREIADNFKIPFDTLSKVLQLLNNNNIINGTKGAKGGYYLSTPLEKIFVTDLFTILEEKLINLDCHEGECSLMNNCNISDPILNFTKILTNFLENLTINELLTNLNTKGPIDNITKQLQASHEC